MNVEGLTPILNVSNMEASFAWFSKVGWKKHWAWGEPPSFGAVINGKMEIFLCLNCQGMHSSTMPPDHSGTWLSWWVESPAAVDEAYREAQAHNLDVYGPPEDMPWNVREFQLRHPDGHVFRVGAGLREE